MSDIEQSDPSVRVTLVVTVGQLHHINAAVQMSMWMAALTGTLTEDVQLMGDYIGARLREHVERSS